MPRRLLLSSSQWVLLLALLYSQLAWAVSAESTVPRIEIHAALRADLRSLEGRIRVEYAGDFQLVDPLAALPMPRDDRSAMRTWPGAPSRGHMDMQPLGQGTWRFKAHLPARYGASGRVPGKGVFLNGGWYPQILVDGALSPAEWDVGLVLPEGVTAALGNSTGRGRVHWSGSGERVGLAALPAGELQVLEVGGAALTLLGNFSGSKVDALRELAERYWPGPRGTDLVVVAAPMMRRLVRSGPGLLFLSQRAFRLSLGLGRFHRRAVARGLLEAGLPLADPWERSFVADALLMGCPAAGTVRASGFYGDSSPESQGAGHLEAAAAGPEGAASDSRSARGILGWFSWLPQVDDLLYDGSTPFVSELLDETFPGDPLQDDLGELFQARIPGRVVARQVGDILGEESSCRVAEKLLDGQEPVEILERLDPAWVESWDRPYPEQDYRLVVSPHDGGALVTVQRQAPPSAGPEVVEILVDGSQHTWLAGSGSDSTSIPLDDVPRRVELDPQGHLSQADLAHDSWPARWTVVLTAFPTVWALSSGYLEAFAAIRLRRRHDTRRFLDLYAYTDQEDLVGALLSQGFAFGPLQDRRYRPQRLYLWLGPSLLDPEFRPTDAGTLDLGAGMRWVWDTRVNQIFPLKGHRLEAELAAGFVPGGGVAWRHGTVSGVGLLSPHPRLVLAARVGAGLAEGQVEHRLLPLGGSDALRCMDADLLLGRERVLAMGELRVAPLRHVSVPLLLGWLDEWQVSLGVEAGRLGGVRENGEFDGQELRALGWTAGSSVGVDVLGAKPTLMGVLAAQSLRTWPSLAEPPPTRLYLLWWQAF